MSIYTAGLTQLALCRLCVCVSSCCSDSTLITAMLQSKQCRQRWIRVCVTEDFCEHRCHADHKLRQRVSESMCLWVRSWAAVMRRWSDLFHTHSRCLTLQPPVAPGAFSKQAYAQLFLFAYVAVSVSCVSLATWIYAVQSWFPLPPVCDSYVHVLIKKRGQAGSVFILSLNCSLSLSVCVCVWSIVC